MSRQAANNIDKQTIPEEDRVYWKTSFEYERWAKTLHSYNDLHKTKFETVKDLMQDLYIRQKLGQPAMEKLLHKSRTTIRNVLVAFGFMIRQMTPKAERVRTSVIIEGKPQIIFSKPARAHMIPRILVCLSCGVHSKFNLINGAFPKIICQCGKELADGKYQSNLAVMMSAHLPQEVLNEQLLMFQNEYKEYKKAKTNGGEL
jgi:hypothetical protein